MWTIDKLAAYVVPENLDDIVDRARRADFNSNGDRVGQIHKVHQMPIAVELANVLIRRIDESITRMLPRYAAAARL